MFHTCKHTPSVTYVCPNHRMECFSIKEAGEEPRKVLGEGDSGLFRTLTGILMRGRDPGSSQERLKAMEDTLGARKGQFDAAGKKNCRKR